MSHRTFIESTAVTTAFWLDQYGGRFASIFRRCPPSMFWGQCIKLMTFNFPSRYQGVSINHYKNYKIRHVYNFWDIWHRPYSLKKKKMTRSSRVFSFWILPTKLFHLLKTCNWIISFFGTWSTWRTLHGRTYSFLYFFLHDLSSITSWRPKNTKMPVPCQQSYIWKGKFYINISIFFLFNAESVITKQWASSM